MKNFIYRIIDFVKRLLLLDKLNNKPKEKKYEEEFYQKYKVNSISSNNKEVYENKKRINIEDKILEIVENNPEKLYNLSETELEKINNILKQKIGESKIKLNKIKNSN